LIFADYLRLRYADAAIDAAAYATPAFARRQRRRLRRLLAPAACCFHTTPLRRHYATLMSFHATFSMQFADTPFSSSIALTLSAAADDAMIRHAIFFASAMLSCCFSPDIAAIAHFPPQF
jgi:hypothetical protein